ncbi:TPA: DUF2514 family protein [Citrobacter braakii]|uniref:DUF2514 family protein n=1 Tax=Citrobacter braakii TaxID=57706 RepID=UPI00103A7048|nr:DUF2514 family protein [Citrobacter braakii]NCL81232.1 DUF2514 family protein [Citrobacter braakii]TCC82593.1 DUF2514 family protein [Citrobacter braakii]HAT7504357.1 DUF2514 family protein [Citrobacter braakii]
MLSVTLCRLRTDATKLARRLNAAKHTGNLAVPAKSKTAGADVVILSDMLGNFVVDAKYYAEMEEIRLFRESKSLKT